MNAFVVVFAAALAIAQAGVIAPVGVVAHSVVAPGVKSTLVQGPSTSAHIVGADGSQIIAQAPGASIRATESVGVAAEVISPAVAAAYSTPFVAHHSAYAAPIAAAYSAPIAAAYSAPVVAAHHPALAYSAPLAYSGYGVFPAGHGIEGQYVHDLNEKFYDDGSYKGEFYH